VNLPTAKQVEQVIAFITQPIGPHDLTKKWSPFLDGLGKRESELVAVSMEREAKFLTGLQSSGALPDTTIGRWLKFFFPLIRRTAPQLTVLDRIALDSDELFAGRVLEIIEQEFELLLITEAQYHPGMDYSDGGPEQRQLLSELAGRLATSIKCLG